ncbi:MAG: ABC-type transport auxiliary lipoprotein family protein [Burkholderiales bacterium]
MLKKALLPLLIASLAGCVNLGDNSSDHLRQTFVLEDLPGNRPAITVVLPYTLLVETTRSSSFDNNESLVFSRSPHTRGRYQYAHWSELPSVRWSELLFARLSNSPLYATVVDANSDVSADRHLSTELLSFYDDATTQPGYVRVELRAQLIDSKRHRLIARRVFVQNVPLTSFNAAGAAAAFNIAAHNILNDLTKWLVAADSSH